MAALTVRVYEYLNGTVATGSTELERYADADQVSAWAREAIMKAVAGGFMQGQAPDRFNPQAEATRAEAAQLIRNLLQRY
ncbi:S-layer homology domain-containing protein [Paenibacillus alginolyticus]|uniref:S-layer homology domain-containing protein n=1 Tax=Paenibacillus alginolyticus TaxID=59839 RepID=UPI00041895C6|nr:S-layer homology domain-containing protein [Paenibacillus alginolyticus]MCY9665669.1 S-layer homology domain-containing protein [Paenibacillus alginolyticus]